MDTVMRLVEDKPVVIFSKTSCEFSNSVKQLITSYEANPTVYEVDELPQGIEIEQALQRLHGVNTIPGVPALFIGKNLVGGSDKVMSLHLAGSLAPMLKNAGSI